MSSAIAQPSVAPQHGHGRAVDALTHSGTRSVDRPRIGIVAPNAMVVGERRAVAVMAPSRHVGKPDPARVPHRPARGRLSR